MGLPLEVAELTKKEREELEKKAGARHVADLGPPRRRSSEGCKPSQKPRSHP